MDIEMEATEDEEMPTDDTELEGEEESAKDKLKKLKDKLKRCEQDKMTAMEDLQRAKADFLNARKRLDEEKTADRERSKLRFVEDLLPLCDSFTMALSDPTFQESSKSLKQGILGIHMQLSSILKSYGVEEFGQPGDKFDPNLHEAVAGDTGGDVLKDIVQKGYKMNERVVRHAKVIVG